HSARPTAGDVICSTNAGGAVERARRVPAAGAFATQRCFAERFGDGLADSANRFSLPYSKCKAFAVWKTPYFCANSTAAPHKPSGIGDRGASRCLSRQRSKRR